MDTSETRVTREQAAEIAKVSTRTINRWTAAGILTAEYGPIGHRVPATYDPEEVRTARARWAVRLREALDLETDIKT
jgi:hypothetical protein